MRPDYLRVRGAECHPVATLGRPTPRITQLTEIQE